MASAWRRLSEREQKKAPLALQSRRRFSLPVLVSLDRQRAVLAWDVLGSSNHLIMDLGHGEDDILVILIAAVGEALESDGDRLATDLDAGEAVLDTIHVDARS